jgi:hypothetical protein
MKGFRNLRVGEVISEGDRYLAGGKLCISAVKGFRKLRVGEVIREGDRYLAGGELCISAVKGGKILDRDLQLYYRPLPAKKVSKWTYETRADIFWTIFDGEKKPRARVWNLRDARLICRAVNALGEK